MRRSHPATWLAAAALLLAPASDGDILISMLSDVDIGTVSPTTGTLVTSTDLCVTMTERGRYSITARGDGPGGAFVLDNGVSTVPLRLRYSDRPRRAGVRLRPGEALNGQRPRRRQGNRECRRLSASLEVRLSGTDLEAAPSGNYRGVITLTVAPE